MLMISRAMRHCDDILLERQYSIDDIEVFPMGEKSSSRID